MRAWPRTKPRRSRCVQLAGVAAACVIYAAGESGLLLYSLLLDCAPSQVATLLFYYRCCHPYPPWRPQAMEVVREQLFLRLYKELPYTIKLRTLSCAPLPDGSSECDMVHAACCCGARGRCGLATAARWMLPCCDRQAHRQSLTTAAPAALPFPSVALQCASRWMCLCLTTMCGASWWAAAAWASLR